MFGKMLDDLAGSAIDVARVAVLPAALAVNVAREITKPIGDAALDAAAAVADGLQDKENRGQP